MSISKIFIVILSLIIILTPWIPTTDSTSSVFSSTLNIATSESWKYTSIPTTTLYVGGVGPGNYTSIQTAIDAASEHALIYVYSGTYSEHLTIDKSCSILGENKNTTIIDGGGSNNVVTISADTVTLTEFTIQHSGSSYNRGIYVITNNNTITNTILRENDFGIYLNPGSRNNTLQDNNASYNRWGGIALISDNSDNTIINNQVSNNNWIGVYLYTSDNNIIQGNTIQSNTMDGLYLYASNENTITTNQINQNTWFGIRLHSSSSMNTISLNTIANNLDDGIYLFSSNNNEIKTNYVLHHSLGINMSSSSANNLIYNNYFNNTNNAYDAGTNSWSIAQTPGINILGGMFFGGNYWSDHSNEDGNDNGFCDSPYLIPGNTGIDELPLVTGTSQSNTPPLPPQLTGDTNGTIIDLLNFSLKTTDINLDQVFYLIDWDDGNATDWIGAYTQNETMHISHTWHSAGAYSIKAKAKDIHGAESPWSQPLTITISNISVNPVEAIVEDISIPQGQIKSNSLQMTNITTLGSYTLNITWDPTVVNLTGINSSFGSLNISSNHQAGYSIITSSNIKGISGNIALCDFQWQAIGSMGDTCNLTIHSLELYSNNTIPILLPIDHLYQGIATIEQPDPLPSMDISIDNVAGEIGQLSTSYVHLRNNTNCGSFFLNLTWDTTLVNLSSVTSSHFTINTSIDPQVGFAIITGTNPINSMENMSIFCLTFLGIHEGNGLLNISDVEMYTTEPIPFDIPVHIVSNATITINSTINPVVLSIDDVSMQSTANATTCIWAHNVSTLGSFTLNLSYNPSIISITGVHSSLFSIVSFVNISEGYCTINGYTLGNITGTEILVCLNITSLITEDNQTNIIFQQAELLTGAPTPIQIPIAGFINGIVSIQHIIEEPTCLFMDSILVETGATTQGHLYIENVTALGSFSLNLTWDPLVIAVNNVTSNTFTINTYINNTAGHLQMNGYHTEGMNGSYIIACFEYYGIAPQEIDLVLSDIELLSNQPIPSEIVIDEVHHGTATVIDSVNTSVILSIDDYTINNGEDIEGFVYLENITNLGSFSINISWNPAVIDITSITGTEFNVEPYINHDQGYANTIGYHMNGFSGTTSIFMFQIHPIGGPGTHSLLNLTDVEVLSNHTQPSTILCTEHNGSVTIESNSYIFLEDFYLSPSNGIGAGYIRASNVTDQVGSGEWILTYDTEQFEVITLNHSDFASIAWYDDGNGTVRFNAWTLDSYLTDNFIIAQITIHAKTSPDCGTPLFVESSILYSADPQPYLIPHATHEGIIRTCNYTAGDLNGDGSVDSADLRYFALYICGRPNFTPLYAPADMNSDGQLNSADIRYMAMFISGDSMYNPLFP